MLQQARNFLLNMATKVNVYQVMTFGMALGAMILAIQIGGGGGTG